MKKVSCVIAILAVTVVGSATPALAKHGWTGPGWYQVFEDLIGGKSLGSGPFTDEKACNAKLPPDDVGRFACAYFQQDPGLEPFG